MTSSTNKLLELYNKMSKHSSYQLLHPRLEKIVKQDEIHVKSRSEIERINYFVQNLDFNGKLVADIGGNTGYFSFAALDHGAACVDYYEGNQEHSQFVKTATQALSLVNNIIVHFQYIDLAYDQLTRPVDIVILLNVLHHIGEDYGSDNYDKDDALIHVADVLRHMADQARYMVFQLGFNWKGDRNLPLFQDGTKAQMIEFVRSISADYWSMENIGVAERIGNAVFYRDLNTENIERDDSLGEFLNRPIFILKSKCI